MTIPLRLIETTIGEIRREATDVLSFELRPRADAVLPPFTAGAHIDVHLPGQQTRSYSLLNEQSDRDRYVIAVRKEASGRGGSRHMHDGLVHGGQLTISAPKNHFPLVEDARHVVFIAGGIGITPILSMIRRLVRLERSFELHYCARTRAHAAFYDQLDALPSAGPRRVHFHFDEGASDRMLDIGALVRRTDPDAHLYCCGPLGMMSAFREAISTRPAEHIHVEYFSGAPIEQAAGGFEVELARSRRTVIVMPGQSILDAVAAVGIDAPHSCKEGVCGSCETRVISGVPDHRDLVLTASERESGETLMICCSGSLGPKLVLDL